MKKIGSVILLSLITIVRIVGQPLSKAEQSNPLNMLVLGDSIMWGQGLKPEHKTWHLVKVWLETRTGRKVIEHIEAHSGALVESGETDDKLRSNNAEVNVARPTVNEQLDSAVEFYADAAQVELVLLSGCGADVGVENLLNASKTEEIDDMTLKRCSTPMERILRRIARAFRRVPLSLQVTIHSSLGRRGMILC